MIDAQTSTSTRPYLIRAIYEWCTDNGLTPYVAVRVDDGVQVPREYVKDGEIVLNISFEATGSLKLGNEFIEFSARFAGVAREIIVPVDHVIAIYARENGQGMAFPPSDPAAASQQKPATGAKRQPEAEAMRGTDADVKLVRSTPAPEAGGGDPPSDPGPGGARARPNLTRIK